MALVHTFTWGFRLADDAVTNGDPFHFCCKAFRKRFSDVNGAMLAARATDGNRQVVTICGLVTR